MPNFADYHPMSDSYEQRFSNIHTSSELADHGFPRVWIGDCTPGWPPDPPRLSSNSAYTSWVPNGNGLGLSGIYRPEPVWSAERHPHPFAASILNQSNTGFFCPSSRSEQEISRDMLHFWQPPTLYHPSVYEEGALTGTFIPRSAHTVTPLHVLEGPTCQILTDRIQETVFFPRCGLNFACNESLLKHQRTRHAKRKEFIATCEVVPPVRGGPHEAVLVTDNPNGYNQNWSHWDMIAFTGFLRDEMEVICQWTENTTVCNDRVKGKDFTAHLQHKHRVISNSQAYSCLWRECPASQPMSKSSLERHVKEQHFSVKWACPTCTRKLTRKTTLMAHFKNCPGHVEHSAP